MTKERADAFLKELTELSNKHDIAILPDGMEVEGLQLDDLRDTTMRGKYALNTFYDTDRYFNWVWVKP